MKKNLKQSFLSLFLVLIIGFFFLNNNLTHADQYDDQINVLQSKIDQSQSIIQDLKAQADTLKNKLAILDEQIAITRQALEKTRVEINQVNTQIAELQSKLEVQRQALSQNLRLIYQEGELQPLELLFSSENLSDYVKRQEYLNSIKTKVEDSVKEVIRIKEEQEEKRSELDKLGIAQQAQIDNIASQQAEQQQLLVQTQGQEEQYQNLVKSDQQSIANLRSQQAAAIAAASVHVVTFGQEGTGGYPWAGYVQDSGADPWGFYYRECTSYAAWKRSSIGRAIPAWGTMGQANAKDWPNWARKFGYTVDQTPEVGALGVYQGGTYGHVMVVEKILSGGKVLVSEYNANFTGVYSTSEWSVNSLVFIH